MRYTGILGRRKGTCGASAQALAGGRHNWAALCGVALQMFQTPPHPTAAISGVLGAILPARLQTGITWGHSSGCCHGLWRRRRRRIRADTHEGSRVAPYLAGIRHGGPCLVPSSRPAPRLCPAPLNLLGYGSCDRSTLACHVLVSGQCLSFSFSFSPFFFPFSFGCALRRMQFSSVDAKLGCG